MSDRVGDDGLRLGLEILRQASETQSSFSMAMHEAAAGPRAAVPDVATTQTNVADKPSGNRSNSRRVSSDQTAEGFGPDGLAMARPAQSAGRGRSVEGAVESASGKSAADADVGLNRGANRGAPASGVPVGLTPRGSAGDASEVMSEMAEAEQELVETGGWMISESSEPVPIALMLAQGQQHRGGGDDAEKQAVLETLHGLADGSLTSDIKQKVLAEAKAKIAAGIDGSATLASANEFIAMLESISQAASEILSHPYDGLDFANLFDELFWIRNWLALFGAGQPDYQPIAMEESLSYSVNSAMMAPLELALTRATIEPMKPTAWDVVQGYSRPGATSPPDDDKSRSDARRA